MNFTLIKTKSSCCGRGKYAQRKGCRQHWMQLQELILAGSLALILTGSALELAVRSWKYCTASADFAHAFQEITVVRGAWRDFIHNCPSEVTVHNPGLAGAGEYEAQVVDGMLLLQSGSNLRKVRLPNGAEVSFSKEQTASGPADVLTLKLAMHRLPGRTAYETRILACRKDR